MMQFPPVVELGREASRKISENIHQNIQDSNQQAVDIEQRISSLNKDFEDLQVIAEELSIKYAKTALKPGGDMNKRELLQPILDHSLSLEDVQLCCRYIKYLFRVILTFIQEQNDTYRNITNMVFLHRQRVNSSHLTDAYDSISKTLGLDNSGKSGSCIFELYEFLRDFQHASKQSLEGNRNLKTENEFDKNLSYKETIKMPTSENLNSSDLANYAILKIKTMVYNDSLSKALICCIKGVCKSTKSNMQK